MIRLSSSSLSIFENCLRCFYFDRRLSLPRPRGISSSLPTAIDGILKEKMNEYRGSLPPQFADVPELAGFQLYCGADLKKLQHWKTNPYKMTDVKGNAIVGAFDDLLYNPATDEYAICDFKTKGTCPDDAYCEKYYQKQMNIYTRFLELGGKKVTKFAVLFYFWSEPSPTDLIEFESKAFFLTPNTADAEKLFKEAIECLEGPMPMPSDECEYCAFTLKRSVILKEAL